MKKNLRELIFSAIFAALLSLSAYLQIPFPMVPMTAQTLFVMLAGILLGKKVGTMACFLYLLLGLLGLPVFTRGGGIGYLLKPTFGYLLGFVVAASIIGTMTEKKKTIPRFFLACGIGLLAIYGLGTGYYAVLGMFYFKTEIAMRTLWMTCVVSTLPVDMIWLVVAVFLGKRLQKPMENFIK